MLQMCPSSERVSKVCKPHTVDTREMGVVHDDVMQIVTRQQERPQEHIPTQMHELRSAVYSQYDEVMQIVTRQQGRQEHILTKMHELRSAAYNQHHEVMQIVTRQQMLLEQMSTKLGIRWKDLKESRGTSLGKPKESLKTYVSTV